MRITFLTHFPGRGGSTVLLAQLAGYFASQGHAITVVCGSDDPTPILNGYLVASKGKDRRSNYLRLIESTTPDLVYSISGVEELDLMRSLRVPRVRHVSSLETHDTIDIRKLVRECAAHLDLVTANTPDVLREIQQLTNGSPPGKLAPYRFSQTWFEMPQPSLDSRAGRLKVCFTGRLEFYQKRAHWLAKIVPAAEAAQIPLEWHIHGEGPEMPWLQRRLASAPVYFHGWGTQESIRQAFQNYDLFFLCSRWEGLPIAMVEAMLSGQTCVVPAIPAGIVDLLENTGAGWMYEATSIDHAVAALKEAQASGEIPIRRRAAQELARKKFSPATTQAQLAELEKSFLSLEHNGRTLDIAGNRPVRSGLFLGRARYRLKRMARSFSQPRKRNSPAL